MTSKQESPPAGDRLAQKCDCLEAVTSEITRAEHGFQSFCIRLADKVEDERRRIEERIPVVDDDADALLLEETADFLMDLDEALRRHGGAE